MAALAATTPLDAEVLEPSAFGVLAQADIVIVGELHDNRAHHDNQAAIAAVLQPKALVFEMIGPDQANRGQNAPRDDADALEAALGWSESWSWFDMYAPIFQAAPDAKIYGAAVPRDTVRAAVGSGAAAQFDAPAQYGLDQPLDAAEQDTREQAQMAAHCNALPESMLGGMVEAQRLRDASFAKTAVQALRETGGPVLVITGNGHARTDWGMPRYLRRAAPDADVVAVGQLLDMSDSTPPYDRWIVTGSYSPSTSDPCSAFQSN